MKNHKAAILLSAALVLGTGTVMAEDEIILDEINGDAMINQGEAYSVATKGMAVKPGDQLMVTDGGLAILVYPNGCTVEVNGEYILSVPKDAPCAAGALLATVGGTETTMTTGGIILATLAGGAALYYVVEDDDKDTISQ